MEQDAMEQEIERQVIRLANVRRSYQMYADAYASQQVEVAFQVSQLPAYQIQEVLAKECKSLEDEVERLETQLRTTCVEEARRRAKNHFPGVTIQRRHEYSYDEQAAMQWCEEKAPGAIERIVRVDKAKFIKVATVLGGSPLKDNIVLKAYIDSDLSKYATPFEDSTTQPEVQQGDEQTADDAGFGGEGSFFTPDSTETL